MRRGALAFGLFPTLESGMLIRLPLAAILALLMCAAPALAATASADKTLGTFGQWQASSSTTNNQPVCYMTLTKAFPKIGKTKRGTAYLMITHRPSEGSSDVVSYTSGYVFKAIDDVTLKIGKDDFSLFTQKDTAWARDTRTDHAIAAAIKANKVMTITGSPAAKGAKPVTDKIDLTGADKAYAAIGKACGLLKEAPKTTKPKAKTPPVATAKKPVKPAKTTPAAKKTTHK